MENPGLDWFDSKSYNPYFNYVAGKKYAQWFLNAGHSDEQRLEFINSIKHATAAGFLSTQAGAVAAEFARERLRIA
jgi:hypothetical protein